ncbi:MAG TPA: NAD(P) transhydrogenase subunit alpha [Acidimicrobiales bacterium]|nr:NAD(P) transhydrogenase subunit alpha [Acidimicrobiales bacterium]
MTGFLTLFTIFVLSVFLGFEVISKVPSVLHTPLMSGTNAIHGIILVGAIAVLATADSALLKVIGFLAVALATVNVVGGFVVTDRMLEMFKGRAQHTPGTAQPAPPEAVPPAPAAPAGPADTTQELPR